MSRCGCSLTSANSVWSNLNLKYRNLPTCQLANPITSPPLLQGNRIKVGLSDDPRGLGGYLDQNGEVKDWKTTFKLHKHVGDVNGDGKQDKLLLHRDQVMRNGKLNGVEVTALTDEAPGVPAWLKQVDFKMAGEQITVKPDGEINRYGGKAPSIYIGGQKLELAPGERKVFKVEEMPDLRRPGGKIKLEYAIERDKNGDYKFITPESTFGITSSGFGNYREMLAITAEETLHKDPVNAGKTFVVSNDQISTGILGKQLANPDFFKNIFDNGSADKDASEFFGDLNQYVELS